MNKITLYGLNKAGGHKVWSIHTDGSNLVIEHGQLDGKLQVKTEVISGKNIGRSNETSPEQQAELEALSRINKQKDKGYREDKEELVELPLLPMLAADYLKQGHRIKYPCYASAKLDGVRCLAIRTEEGVQLKSRGGKFYNVLHIQEQLMCMQVGEVWDGELYKHGLFLEEIVSAVKKTNPNTALLQFVVFDFVNEQPFNERLEGVGFVTDENLPSVIALQYIKVNNDADMKAQHKIMVGKGYEGIMLRNAKGVYESGKRSADLQKFKTFLDEEFEIVAVGTDKNDNAVLKVFDTLSGETFNVCYGDFEQRKHQLENWREYVGKMLTVKYQTRYKDSKLPQFPTGVCIRDYE